MIADMSTFRLCLFVRLSKSEEVLKTKKEIIDNDEKQNTCVEVMILLTL